MPDQTPQTPAPDPLKNMTGVLLHSKLVGFGLLALSLALSWLRGPNWGTASHADTSAIIGPVSQTLSWSLLVAYPFVQGLMIGFLGKRIGRNFRTNAATGLVSFGIDLLLAIIVLHEGVICLIIASPLIMGLLYLGMAIGQLFVRSNKTRLEMSLLPVVALVVFAQLSNPHPDTRYAVTDSVTVKAPPARVWTYVVSHPVNTYHDAYWLWDIGLPQPTQSVATEQKIGARRDCRFSKGLYFQEEISALEPQHRLEFRVVRQPQDPEILGHMSLEKGEIRLQDNKNGTTTLVATSWYHLYEQPAAYFNLFADDIVRQVHFRVLNHIHRLSEDDPVIIGPAKS